MTISRDPECAFVDVQLASIVERCVRSALRALRELVESGATPKRATHFVRITTDDSGRRIRSADGAPFDYGSLLKSTSTSSWEAGINLDELQGYREVDHYLRNVPEYWQALSCADQLKAPQYPDWPESWFGISLHKFLSRITDRHIHTSGWEFDQRVFNHAYASFEPIIRTGFAEVPPLTVDILVPLLGISFEADRSPEIADIERLEGEQLAACWPGHRIDKEDEALLLDATHAWVQRDLPVTVQPLTGWPVLSSLNFDALERLLEVIAASVHCPFGVKHVLYRPRGWAESWVGDTPAGGTWTWTYERSANGLGRSEVAPKSIH